MLRDAELRAAFRRDPKETALQLGVEQGEFSAFLRLNSEQLDRQAEALVAKRWHEAARLVPITVGRLGAEGPQLFQYYAQAYWPQTHRRHLLDAARFLRFLLKNGIGVVDENELRTLRRMLARRGGRPD